MCINLDNASGRQIVGNSCGPIHANVSLQILGAMVATLISGRAYAMRALTAPTIPSLGSIPTRLLRRPSAAYTSTLHTSALDSVMTDCQQQQCSEGLQHGAVPDKQQPHPQQQQQQSHSDASDITDPRCWTKQMAAAYMAYGRNWGVSTPRVLTATDSSGATDALRETIGERAVSKTCCCP
jgi:hypothetical protein